MLAACDAKSTEVDTDVADDGEAGASDGATTDAPGPCDEYRSEAAPSTAGPHAVTLRFRNTSTEPLYLKFNGLNPEGGPTYTVEIEGEGAARTAVDTHASWAPPSCDDLLDGEPACADFFPTDLDYYKLAPGAHLDASWPDAGWLYHRIDRALCGITAETSCPGEGRTCGRWTLLGPGPRFVETTVHAAIVCPACDCDPINGVCVADLTNDPDGPFSDGFARFGQQHFEFQAGGSQIVELALTAP